VQCKRRATLLFEYAYCLFSENPRRKTKYDEPTTHDPMKHATYQRPATQMRSQSLSRDSSLLSRRRSRGM